MRARDPGQCSNPRSYTCDTGSGRRRLIYNNHLLSLATAGRSHKQLSGRDGDEVDALSGRKTAALSERLPWIKSGEAIKRALPIAASLKEVHCICRLSTDQSPVQTLAVFSQDQPESQEETTFAMPFK